jgi:cold shock protein
MSESFSKKEKANKKAKAKRDKAEKMAERKANNNKGKSLEDMMAYIDENGNISDTPPDERNRREIDLDSIQLGAAPIVAEDTHSKGRVSFFNEAKGYGFIVDEKTNENIFFHTSSLSQPVKEKDRVSFEKERTARGYSAIRVVKI